MDEEEGKKTGLYSLASGSVLCVIPSFIDANSANIREADIQLGPKCPVGGTRLFYILSS